MTIRTASAPNPEELVQLETSATAYGWTRQHYQDSITAGHQFFVAQHQNELVGFAVVMTVLDEAELLNIVIHQAHQGQGWGKRLLCHAIATLQHQNMHKLLLEVRESNQFKHACCTSIMALLKQVCARTITPPPIRDVSTLY
ncbi:GNAT family N-acetyltransferase [Paludibacterium denitrificans]|uniref:GNAT family N-acetyltransferase n=1 Tax=Paludibacterium denitrificans TaxID=2675226 RepID=UPI001E3CDC4C|nr:GNAT family N-acetyltransferase [Paludibacterium denitrificans]